MKKFLLYITIGILIGVAGTIIIRNAFAKYYPWIEKKIDRTFTTPQGIDDWELASRYKLHVAATGFDMPTRIVFPPASEDSNSEVHFYVAELGGAIRCVLKDGTIETLVDGLLNYEREPLDELGLFGLDIHPNGQQLFCALTYWDGHAGVYRNKIESIELTLGGKRASKRQIILDITSEATVASYQICFVKVAPDGTLFAGIGSGANKQDAVSLEKFAGKIIHMDIEGNALPDNPFYDAEAPTSARSYIYAYGIRNPYDMAWHPNGQHAIVSDVGPGLDRVFRLEKGESYCFKGGESGDGAMRSNALYTFGPGAQAPTGLCFVDNAAYGMDEGHSLLVGVFGPVHTSGSGDYKCIHRFDVSPTARLAGVKETIVRYNGVFYSSVTDIEVGNNGEVYFADPFGDGDEPHKNKGTIYRLSKNEAQPTTDAQVETHSVAGQAIFKKYACVSCHDLHSGTSKKEGPSLGNVRSRLLERLASKAYLDNLDELAENGGEFYANQKNKYDELRSLNGIDRVRAWFAYHVRNPRFDLRNAKMPSNSFITDDELIELTDFLIGK